MARSGNGNDNCEKLEDDCVVLFKRVSNASALIVRGNSSLNFNFEISSSNRLNFCNSENKSKKNLRYRGENSLMGGDLLFEIEYCWKVWTN